MSYYSTNNPSLKVSLKEAVLNGLAPDNGLYMPERISPLPSNYWSGSTAPSFNESSFQAAHTLIGDEIPSSDLRELIDEAITFDAPLVQLSSNLAILELFHGPTLAFKDFGARFLSALTRYFLRGSQRELRVLVATSGDTGSAVASAFFNCPNVKVILLYPKGKVSEIQEKQLTTMGGNITAVEVDGVFDDCQRLVKQAFLDEELKKDSFMTSANSINIARLIPQSFYYVHSSRLLASKNRPQVFSVPSGNFGNLTAGVIAKRMGAAISRFIAATNANDIVPMYLQNGVFESKPSISTLSNAMDVGNPSNFVRLLELYNNDWASIGKEVAGCSISDAQTLQVMRQTYQKYMYTLDPHGAVALFGLNSLPINQNVGVVLATAHPAKFGETVKLALGVAPEMPDRLRACLSKPKLCLSLSTTEFREFKELLKII